MIVLVGLNHTTAPLALRERLYVGKTAQGRLLQEIIALPGIDEVVILSTCNRTEVYACAQDLSTLVNFLAGRAAIPQDALLDHLYVEQGHEAARHLFRVATGLDSLVIGETQILGQVGDALAMADAEGTARRILNGLFQHAVATGKRARTETNISEGAFSVGRIAVELARSLFTELAGHPVLILGAGKMSELSAKHLAAHGAAPLYVANRTPDHARVLAARLGAEIVAFTDLASKLAEIDILISSTGAPHLILHRDVIAQAMAQRDGRPLFMIDIAIPRDIDPEAAEIPGVYLYNIDDLDTVAEAVSQQRAEEIPRVEAIVGAEVERWRQRQAGLEAAPVISALRDSCERLRREELDRVAGALSTLTPEQRGAVEALTASLISKLLHTPTVHLKSLLARERAALPLVCELFDLAPAEDEDA